MVLKDWLLLLGCWKYIDEFFLPMSLGGAVEIAGTVGAMIGAGGSWGIGKLD